MVRRAVVCALSLAAVALAACSGDDDGSSRLSLRGFDDYGPVREGCETPENARMIGPAPEATPSFCPIFPEDLPDATLPEPVMQAGFVGLAGGDVVFDPESVYIAYFQADPRGGKESGIHIDVTEEFLAAGGEVADAPRTVEIEGVSVSVWPPAPGEPDAGFRAMWLAGDLFFSAQFSEWDDGEAQPYDESLLEAARPVIASLIRQAREAAGG